MGMRGWPVRESLQLKGSNQKPSSPSAHSMVVVLPPVVVLWWRETPGRSSVQPKISIGVRCLTLHKVTKQEAQEEGQQDTPRAAVGEEGHVRTSSAGVLVKMDI